MRDAGRGTRDTGRGTRDAGRGTVSHRVKGYIKSVYLSFAGAKLTIYIDSEYEG